MVPGLPGIQMYTYGRIMAKGWRLSRTETDGHLFPEAATTDTQILKSLLVLPRAMVSRTIQQLEGREWFPRTVIPDLYDGATGPAEELLASVNRKALSVSGVAIEACATYHDGLNGPEIVVVDATGGLSYGLQSREGIATEMDLALHGLQELRRAEAA